MNTMIKIKKAMLCFVTLSLVIASAGSASHNLTLFQTSTIAGKQLKAGDYKLELNGDKVAIKSGKQVLAETAVKVETESSKYSTTSVRYLSDSKNQVQEIRIGGTTTKLVFNDAGNVAP
jgi:hypothetical protein